MNPSVPRLEITGLEGIGEVRPGDDLARLLAVPLRALRADDGDVIAVTQKVVSKAEGRIVPDVDRLEVIARETEHVLAARGDLIITRTRHGFVCANAGVDASNVELGMLSLLPENPDASAAALRTSLRDRVNADVAVIITDTFGRAWRRGVVNVAIGCAGLPAVVDLRGRADHAGRTLEATEVALADEIAAASGLVMAKDAGVPAAHVRGVDRLGAVASTAADLLRSPSEDLFPASPASAVRSMGRMRSMAPGAVPRPFLIEAFAAAIDAQEPAASYEWRFEVLESRASRAGIAGISGRLDDSRLAGATEDAVVVVPSVSLPEPGPSLAHAAKDDMTLLMDLGATIAYVRLCLRARALSTRWTVAPAAARDSLAKAVGCGDRWTPLGILTCAPSPSGEVPALVSDRRADVSWK
jgi:coenzyme F420-0:L-glutamate ligase/coenzyme F420-1:gamma-L-glutamate ligase